MGVIVFSEALTETTIVTDIAAAGATHGAVAFGAVFEIGLSDGRFDGFSGFGRLRDALQPALHDEDAFGDRLLRGGKQAFVEPDGMGAGGGIERAGDFASMKTAAEHFGSEFADTGRDGTGDEDLHDVIVVVVDGDIKVLSVKGNLPGGAGKFFGPVFPIGSALLGIDHR